MSELCVWQSRKNRYSESLHPIVYSKINLDWKMNSYKSGLNENWVCKAGLWYLSDSVVPKHFTRLIITVRNEVAKVMFLQVCVCPQGVSAPRGCLVPGGLVQGRRVCLVPGGCLIGGGACLSACWDTNPPSRERQLLLQTVRILLECISCFRWKH